MSQALNLLLLCWTVIVAVHTYAVWRSKIRDPRIARLWTGVASIVLVICFAGARELAQRLWGSP